MAERGTVVADNNHPYVTGSNMVYLRNRKHFPCFYRVIETRVKVWEKREIAWDTSTKCECFHAISSFSQTFTSGEKMLSRNNAWVIKFC